MKLLTSQQIREWDKYTIENEPIASIDLMERAALSFVNWFVNQIEYQGRTIAICCGNGNNGGDGLAIARLLSERLCTVRVYILRFAKEDSIDFDINLSRIIKNDAIFKQFLHDSLPEFETGSIIIDALIGIGAKRAGSDMLENLIEHINSTKNKIIISVDLPSGLPADGIYFGITIRPDIIFTFEIPKLSFFYRENQKYTENWIVGQIGLHPSYIKDLISDTILIDVILVKDIYKKRSKYQHKGDFGHVLFIAGSEGKIGAGVLGIRAALRTGAGLVTAMIPTIGREIMHETTPEAMVEISGQTCFNVCQFIYDEKYSIGCGPGLGNDKKTGFALENLIKQVKKPIVLDADALNIIASKKLLLTKIPKNSILTPHPKEFERLFGKSKDSFQMFALQAEISKKYELIIILKGAHTRVTLPNGKTYINCTGNPGMATGGSGDVLTGIITGLLAQKYSPENAAIFGVYIHGLAGDLALQTQSQESLVASDIIMNIGNAYIKLNNYYK